MPLFAVHALDKKDALPLRLEHYAPHRAYVETAADYGVTVIFSGPLQSDDGEMMIGSLFVIEAEGRAQAEKFNVEDPFHVAGVWGDVTITRFHKRKG
jgi:uncharacterized protein YciI